jgi:hypothetical protein
LGLQGAYITAPVHFFETDNLATSYLYYYGENLMPSINEIENNLSFSVDILMPQCVNFSLFPELEINAGNPTTETTIVDDGVIFDTNWPITLRNNEITGQILQFNQKIDLNFIQFYDAANAIIQKTESNPTFIDHGYLLLQFMNITYSIYDENTILYQIKEIDLDNTKMDYTLMFATKVDLTS